jgi:hypothetical protein
MKQSTEGCIKNQSMYFFKALDQREVINARCSFDFYGCGFGILRSILDVTVVWHYKIDDHRCILLGGYHFDELLNEHTNIVEDLVWLCFFPKHNCVNKK